MGFGKFFKSFTSVWDAEEVGEEVGRQMYEQGLEELSDSTLEDIHSSHNIDTTDWVAENAFYRGMGNGYKESEQEAANSDKPWWQKLW